MTPPFGNIFRLTVTCTTLLASPLKGQNNTYPWPQSGNVGIGTNNPGFQLHIKNPTGYSWLGIDSGPNTASVLAFVVNGTTRWWLQNGIGNGAADTFGIWDNTAGAARLYINNSGSVGIGTTNPQHLLHVAGTIGAEEVIVTSTGADYVFEAGYRLKPLREVASYIRQHHHLPDIPPAEDAQAKGVSVGEMQTKLLAKIEELTLHMIRADERNNRLEKQNQELRDRIARLEAGAAR